MFEILFSIFVVLAGAILYYPYVKRYMPHDPAQTPSEPQTPPQGGGENQNPQGENTVPNIDTLLPWTTKENCRHNVRVICDLEGLTVEQKNELSATVHCESNYNPFCVHPNEVNGRTTSTDYGIAQINDFWHIGPGKDFPSVDYVLNNPEASIRWMCRAWKENHSTMWVCKLKGMYLNYSA